jgi:hypothetical protein
MVGADFDLRQHRVVERPAVHGTTIHHVGRSSAAIPDGPTHAPGQHELSAAFIGLADNKFEDT